MELSSLFTEVLYYFRINVSTVAFFGLPQVSERKAMIDYEISNPWVKARFRLSLETELNFLEFWGFYFTFFIYHLLDMFFFNVISLYIILIDSFDSWFSFLFFFCSIHHINKFHIFIANLKKKQKHNPHHHKIDKNNPYPHNTNKLLSHVYIFLILCETSK